jgi:hypothetical protein
MTIKATELLKLLSKANTLGMTKQEIGATIGFYIAIGLVGWALVSFFPLTWIQALIISWMYNKLIDVLE